MASVFEVGKLSVEFIKGEPSKEASSPPKPVLIATPTNTGEYPVILFLHGFFLQNHYYGHLLEHIASHGFIVVAPQLYTFILPCSTADINCAAAITNWLYHGLQALLPEQISPNLNNIALAGHSRGGHAAFSLALGHAQTTFQFSALIGIDPVAGTGSYQIPPRILTHNPCSFDLTGTPVLVIGSGLGAVKKCGVFPACAPDGVNHEEFYYECQPPSYYLVVKKYGHMDMLDDDAPKFTKCVCENGENCRDLMRRSVGGIVVAFLKAYLKGEEGYLKGIIDDPSIAPTELYPVSQKKKGEAII